MDDFDTYCSPEELLSLEWTCPACSSVELSQSMDDGILEDGTYPWYCLHCGWVGTEDELEENEVAL